MLKKDYIRDGNRKIIGSVTTGFSDTSSVERDEGNRIIGRTNERFHTTRDGHGNLVVDQFLRSRSPDRAQEVAPRTSPLRTSTLSPLESDRDRDPEDT